MRYDPRRDRVARFCAICMIAVWAGIILSLIIGKLVNG